MQFLVQTLLIFFLLLPWPWFGDFAIEAKAALIGFISVTSSLSLMYLIDLFLAPSRIDKDQLHEIATLREAIRETFDEDQAVTRISNLYQEGKRMEHNQITIEGWFAKVEAFVIANLSAGALHEFRVARDDGFDAVLSWLNRLARFPSPEIRGPLVNSLLAQKEIWAVQGPGYTDNTGTWADVRKPG